jgi:hypothetical protein
MRFYPASVTRLAPVILQLKWDQISSATLYLTGKKPIIHIIAE